MDEPASGLINAEIDEIDNTLRMLSKEMNIAVLIVEHRIELLETIADRVIVMDAGEIIAEGDLKDVIDKTKVDSDGKKTADTFRKMQKAFQNAEKLAETRNAEISAGGDDAKNMRDGLHWLLSLSNDDIQNIFLTHRDLKICTDNNKAFASMESREKAFEAIDRMIINIIKQNNKNAS